ncbi:hypothetical protein LC593_13575 [Nostoc sp. CHAB 5844]|nr:hypothetical protein [Nostoc sp. CHAB 5844]
MLTDSEVERLRQAIIAAIASPIIGSIEDYTWEAMFHYVKNISLSDPALGRSKLLYDAVDPLTKIGWSLKSLQLKGKSNLDIKTTYYYVIQRADVIKKAIELGFPDLDEISPPEKLGAALIQHWNQKVEKDSLKQKVEISYEGILLKNIQGTEYVYCEYSIECLDSSAFSWAWTVNQKTGKKGVGLQGSIDGKAQLIWYKNQKQLFRARTIPSEAVHVRVERTRLTLDRYVEIVVSALQSQINTQAFEHEPEE